MGLFFQWVTENYNFFLGAPARFARPSGFPLQLRRRWLMGLMVAGSSFLSVALPLPVPQSPRLCGVYATIPGAILATFCYH